LPYKKKAQHIVSLDLRKFQKPLPIFFIICQATNSTQLNAIADFVEEDVRKNVEKYLISTRANRLNSGY
jgi:ribosome-associated protein